MSHVLNAAAYNATGVVVRMTFSELREKEVINVNDGARLGRIIDIVFEVVPGPKCFSDIMKGVRQGYPIKWRCIKAVGVDVILVDVDTNQLYNGIP